MRKLNNEIIKKNLKYLIIKDNEYFEEDVYFKK